MANDISNELKSQLYGQVSDDPFLALFTFSHPSFSSDIRLVNNAEDIVSNGDTYIAYPVQIVLPPDDQESAREVQIQLDNIDLTIISELRGVTTPVQAKVEMVLASLPDTVQYSLEELKLKNISYTTKTITASLVMDDFLGVGLTSEKYNPDNYPGLF
jgi:hypothetical protein